MFQEVTSSLPQQGRLELAELIHSIQASKPKRSSTKRWSGTIPQINQRTRISPKNETIQRYIPRDESAGIKVGEDTNNKQQVSKALSTNTLIGTGRAVRIKEDTSLFYLQETFKIKSMLNNGETFTCWGLLFDILGMFAENVSIKTLFFLFSSNICCVIPSRIVKI